MEELNCAYVRTQNSEKSVERRTHEPAEALERARYPDVGIHFNKDALSGVNVYLKQARFVQRRVK